MIKETKIYLETTIPNVAAEKDTSDRKTATQMLLGEVAKGYYIACISALVIQEINRTKPEKRREQLLQTVHKIKHRFIEITPPLKISPMNTFRPALYLQTIKMTQPILLPQHCPAYQL